MNEMEEQGMLSLWTSIRPLTWSPRNVLLSELERDKFDHELLSGQDHIQEGSSGQSLNVQMEICNNGGLSGTCTEIIPVLLNALNTLWA